MSGKEAVEEVRLAAMPAPLRLAEAQHLEVAVRPAGVDQPVVVAQRRLEHRDLQHRAEGAAEAASS